jgi:hypothetical protein
MSDASVMQYPVLHRYTQAAQNTSVVRGLSTPEEPLCGILYNLAYISLSDVPET